MRMFKYLLVLTAILLIAVSCTTTKLVEHHPRKIAILPIFNETNDMNAENIAYPIVYRAFFDRGYNVVSPTVMFELLSEEKGFHEAGMINAMTPAEIAEYMNADAVMYVTITDWSTKFYGVASTVTVTMEFKLMDPKTNLPIFETTETAQSNSGAEFSLGGLVNAAAHAAIQDYEPIAKQCIYNAANKLERNVFHIKKKEKKD